MSDGRSELDEALAAWRIVCVTSALTRPKSASEIDAILAHIEAQDDELSKERFRYVELASVNDSLEKRIAELEAAIVQLSDAHRATAADLGAAQERVRRLEYKLWKGGG